MILIITNKKDYTADFLILELEQQGIDFVRLNTEDFPQTVKITLKTSSYDVTGHFIINDRVISFDKIRSVWYRRPVPSEPAREVEDIEAKEFIVTESRVSLENIWQLLSSKRWVNHPNKLQICKSKLLQLQVAAQIGFQTPSTLLTNQPSDVQSFYDRHNSSLIYKPLRHASIIHDNNPKTIFTSKLTEEHRNHFDAVQYAPSLFQPLIEKQVDIRVTVVGNKVFAVAIHSQESEATRVDWRRIDSDKLVHKSHKLPTRIESWCIELTQKFDLSFAAIDLILTPKGDYIFLELNPNGQWAWIEQICPDIRIRQSLIELLTNGNKSSKGNNFFQNIWIVTGLRWIPRLFKELPEPIPLGNLLDTEEIQDFLKNLKNFGETKSNLENIIARFNELNEADNQRETQLEGKAMSLIGFTGIATTFILGFIQFLFGNNSFGSEIRNLIGIMYALTSTSLLLTILLAMKSLKVNKDSYMSPDIANFWKLEKEPIIEKYKEHATDVLKTYIYNRGLINNKAQYLSGAQDWFRNTVIVLAILLFILSLQFFGQSNQTLGLIIESPTPIATQEHLTATPNNTMTPTQTNSPTELPTATTTP